MTEQPMIAFQILSIAKDLPVPAYASTGAAGIDLACAEHEVELLPGTWDKIDTGLRVAIPQGFEGQVRPRSGLAHKHGITVLNAPGTIDADYRGNIAVILINHSKMPYTFKRGDRIAQLVIAPATIAKILVVEEMESTTRGEGGFGSTGR